MEYKSPYKDINCRKYNTWCLYLKRIDTYGNGCQHNCSYCYAKALLQFRGHWNNIPLPANLIEIHHKIKQLNKGDIVRLGSMTDCFQPIEKKYGITYETIKLLNHYKIHYLIVTKNSLVSSDKYIEIYDKNLSHFQVSITATNNDDSVKYESASKATDRIKSVEKLYELGFDVTVRLSPFIPEFIDVNVINSISCDKILIEFLKVNHWVKKYMDLDYSAYTHKFGGHENLPLEKKMELVNLITGFKQKSVGEYVKEHHQYFSENVNFNKFDCCNLNYNKPTTATTIQENLFYETIRSN